MSSPSNNKRAHEAQTVDNPRKKVKAGNACATAEGFEPSVLPSTINHQPSAIDQAPSTGIQNSTISQFAAVGQPTSLNANNSKPATGSHDIQTSHEYIITLPDHLVSCQDEMERLITNSLEDIEKNNEILREIKRLNDEGKLEEVESRCYEVLELRKWMRPLRDYLQKQLDLTYNMTDEDVRKFEQRLNISYKKNLADWQDEMEKLIKYSLEPIEENKIWRESEKKLEEVRSRCCEVFELFNGMHPSDYLQKQLNLTFDPEDYDVRRVDLSFYYVFRGEKSQEPYTIIHRSLYPDEDCDTGDFYELCWRMLQELEHDEAFVQLCKRLKNNEKALEYLLYKKPDLLLRIDAFNLIEILIDDTQLDVHQILTDIRDEKGQTCMFYMEPYGLSHGFYKRYFSVDRKNRKDLYDLLSIQNCDGQTALHVNTLAITDFLADIYTRKQREEFIKLTSIEDNTKRTALEITSDYEHDSLSALMNRVKNNEYVMDGWENTRVLIIYNTNKRPGAEEEAQTISDAFKSLHIITFEKNKNKADLIQLIEESANERFSQNDMTPMKSLIVILTSHGSKGTIEDCDGNPIELSAIEQAMCSDILDGLPKMLITQCCQNTTPDVDEKLKAYAPVNDDFCAVMSSVPGQKSTRGVFLGKLAEEIEKSEYTDTTIFKLVNNVSREMEREGHLQTPIIMSTLKAEFCPSDHWHFKKDNSI